MRKYIQKQLNYNVLENVTQAYYIFFPILTGLKNRSGKEEANHGQTLLTKPRSSFSPEKHIGSPKDGSVARQLCPALG